MVFFFSSRRRHTRFSRDWSSDVCSSDLAGRGLPERLLRRLVAARPYQARRALIAVEVLAADGQRVLDADGVVGVDDQVDLGQGEPAGERVDGGPGALRLGAEGARSEEHTS